jgi:hypothetical protein
MPNFLLTQFGSWPISAPMQNVAVTSEGRQAKKTVRRRVVQSGWVFRGITKQAAELNVSRVHLWLVLTGRRSSPPLMRRYHAHYARLPLTPHASPSAQARENGRVRQERKGS